MPYTITPLPLRTFFGFVNSYLLKTDSGHLLIDTGLPKSRADIDTKLAAAGCNPGNLKLIVITHGDFDHIGNCRYLRDKYQAKVAMHADDAGMAERGDMFWNRKKGNAAMRLIAKLLFPFKAEDRFSPDILLKDGDDLVGYGLKAVVLSLPGHSKGSIGVLAENGDLFCGDLFENTRTPGLSKIMDDPETAKLSLKKLENSLVHTVFPGHGNPFLMESLKKSLS